MPIAANGFAVASANFRLVPSVTHPTPVHDVKAAVRWLRAMRPSTGWILTASRSAAAPRAGTSPR
jgi:acetyl esterase/lipase